MPFKAPKNEEFESVKTAILTALSEDNSANTREAIGHYLLKTLMNGDTDDAMTNFQNIGTDGKMLTKKRGVKAGDEPIPLEKRSPKEFKYWTMRKLNDDEDIKEALKALHGGNISLHGIIKAVAIPKWIQAKKRITKVESTPVYERVEPIAVLFVHNQCQKDYKKTKEGEEAKLCIADEINGLGKKTAEDIWADVDKRIADAKAKRLNVAESARALKAKEPDIDELEANVTNPWELFTGKRADKFDDILTNKHARIPKSKREAMIEQIDKCLKLMQEEWVDGYQAMRGLLKRMK